MPTAAQFVSKAASQIGTKESPSGSNKVKYAEWYGMNGQPWCAMFVSWVSDQVGGISLTGKYAYCPSWVNYAKQTNRWLDRKEKPQAGDIVFFSNGSRACHVGIVESRNGTSSVTTIEGNTSTTSNDNGGAVMRRTRSYGSVGSSFYILGFFRPGWNSSSSTTTSDVSQVAQDVINGKYGNGSERKQKLEAAGYNYSEVQAAVNALLKGEASTTGTQSVSKSLYSTGIYTTIVNNLNVRTGAGTGYAKKTKSQLTKDGQKHANSAGQLQKGTRVSVTTVKAQGSNWWGKIPSGWICLENGGKAYVKKG